MHTDIPIIHILCALYSKALNCHKAAERKCLTLDLMFDGRYISAHIAVSSKLEVEVYEVFLSCLLLGYFYIINLLEENHIDLAL